MPSANLTALQDPSNATLLRWSVQLRNDDNQWQFDCMAEGEDHAVAQAMDAEPDAEVISASLCERYFAMLDSEEVVEIRGAASLSEALDNEPGNSHWVFSETGLKAFLKQAVNALAVPTAQVDTPRSEPANYQVTLQALVNVRVNVQAISQADACDKATDTTPLNEIFQSVGSLHGAAFVEFADEVPHCLVDESGDESFCRSRWWSIGADGNYQLDTGMHR